MTVAVFTPTYRPGGLDVLEASLMRQTYRDFVWIVSDQRFLQRHEVWKEINDRVDFPIYFVSRDIPEGNKRNLAAMYNAAREFVLNEDYHMLISLQDYIWAPPDGIEKFVELQAGDNLVTGVTHISRDPFPNKIVDIEGDYTIFKEPYIDKPSRMSWEDVRVTEIYTSDHDKVGVDPGHWEANWAAVPRSILNEISWDETYDKGIAYENADFAWQAYKRFGTQVIMDKTNIAISLPHKDYFSGEREEIEKFSNRDYYDNKWLLNK